MTPPIPSLASLSPAPVIACLAGLATSLLLHHALLGAPTTSANPDYQIHAFTSEDGLRTDSILGLAQDTDGYLWCATTVGIARFDGVRFVLFDRVRTPGLHTRSMQTVQADRTGTIWVTDARDHLLRGRNGQLEPVSILEDDHQAAQIHPFVSEDAAGNRWVRTKGGATWSFSAGDRGGLPTRSSSPVPLPWPGSGPDWYLLPAGSPGTFSFGIAASNGIAPRTAVDDVGTFVNPTTFPRRAGGHWFLEGKGPDRSMRALLPDGSISRPRRVPPLPDDRLTSLVEDAAGNIWAGTAEAGVVRIAPDDTLTTLTLQPGIAARYIRQLLVDREDNIWVATDGAGLARITPRRFHVLGRESGISSEIIYSVAVTPDDRLWVATHGGGLCRQDANRFRPVADIDAFTWAIHAVSDEELWIGDLMNGLCHLKGGRVHQRVAGTTISALCEDPRGGGWAGGHTLYRWQQDTVTRVQEWQVPSTITSLVCNNSGRLFVGTATAGLWRTEGPLFAQVPLSRNIDADEIQALHLDPDHSLWIGTTGDGLYRLHADSVTHVSTAHGLPDPAILGIARDTLGNLWCTSVSGIIRIQGQSLDAFCDGRSTSITAHLFDRQDGLVSSQGTASSQPKIARSRNGRLWFATMHGVATCDPAQLPTNPRPPSVIVEEVLVDQTLHTMAASDHNTLVVPAGTGQIEVRFTATSLTAPSRVRFRHRLSTRSAGWSPPSTLRSHSFSAPPPGTYRFQVSASNNDGLWNPAGTTLLLIVQPHFWQTLAFRIAAGAALVAAAGLVVRQWSLRRLRRELAQFEQQQAITLERARIARDMHDEVGSALTHLTLIASPATLSEPAECRLDQVARLATDIVRKLDELVWAVNPRHDTANSLIDYLCRHAEESLRPAGIRTRFSIPHSLPPLPIPAEHRHQLFLAFKEALTNIIRHAHATEVHFSATTDPGGLHLVLRDDGHGLRKDADAASTTGDGLQNIQERLRSIGGTALHAWGPGNRGFIVEFHLPLPAPTKGS